VQGFIHCIEVYTFPINFYLAKVPNLCVIVLLAKEESFHSLVLRTSVASLGKQVIPIVNGIKKRSIKNTK